MAARDDYLANFYRNAVASLAPDPGTTPVITSRGAGTQPVVQFVSGGKQYYFHPAVGREYEGFNTNLDGTRDYVPAYTIEPENFSNWSNNDNWGSNVSGLPTMRADWAADLVNNSTYKRGGGATEYAGGGWLSEAPIGTATWQKPEDNESWLSQFMQGPGRVIGGGLGISSLANMLMASGALAGAPAFNPTLDFGPGYFEGAGSFAGGGAGAGGVAFDPAAMGDLGIGSDMMNYAGFDPASAGDFSIGAEMRTNLLNTPGGQEYFNRLYPSGGLFGPGGSTSIPVEDRSRAYDPQSQAGSNSPSNILRNLTSIGRESLGGAGGGFVDTRSPLRAIKDITSLSSAVGSVMRGLSMPSDGELASMNMRGSDGARRQVVQGNIDRINEAFKGFDDAYFNRIAGAFRDYYQPQVTRQFDDATKNIIYNAPGGVGSSAYARALADAERERQQAGTEVADRAYSQANNARADIEGTKANLYGLAESSEDPGAFGSQVVSAARASDRAPEYSALGDLVSRYATLANAASGLESRGYGRASSSRPLSFGGGAGSVRVVS